MQLSTCDEGCTVCERLSRAVPGAAVACGVDELTLGELAARAGIDRGDVPAHAELDAIIVHAYIRVLAHLHDTLADGFGAAGTWAGGLRAGLEALLGRFSSTPDEPRFIFVEVPLSDDPQLRALSDEARRGGAKFLAMNFSRYGGGQWPRRLHFELLNGALIHHIADHLRHRSAASLPCLLETLLAIAVTPPARLAA